MDRQTLRDWAHRFNGEGPAGLVNRKAPGARGELSAEQEAELAALIEAGPDRTRDGVVLWHCRDLASGDRLFCPCRSGSRALDRQRYRP